MLARRTKLAACALTTVALGICWRFAVPGLPEWAWKYGGSILWGTMAHFVVASVFARAPPRRAALIAAAVAVLVEVFRLHHTPELDAFRLTLAGRLLLGRVFSPWNVLAYWAGIVIGWVVQERLDARPRNN